VYKDPYQHEEHWVWLDVLKDPYQHEEHW